MASENPVNEIAQAAGENVAETVAAIADGAEAAVEAAEARADAAEELAEDIADAALENERGRRIETLEGEVASCRQAMENQATEIAGLKTGMEELRNSLTTSLADLTARLPAPVVVVPDGSIQTLPQEPANEQPIQPESLPAENADALPAVDQNPRPKRRKIFG